MYHKILRSVLGAAVVLGLLFGQETRVLAGSTGQITGRVVDSTTNAPIALAAVTAISPTGTYKAVTSSNGYYAIVNVFPDTYRITVTAAGYQPGMADGYTVNQNNSTVVNLALSREATVLGRVSVRGVMSVVQPTVAADQYVLTAAAADATNGSGGSMSLYQTPGIIGTLPGVTLDAGGYSHIRGSRFDEVGYEYDGLTTVEPMTGTFSTNLVEDGISRLQVSTGGYSADGGNAISGEVNTVVGVGTYPARGSITTLVQSPTFYHGLNFEYGSATPDGRFSWYAAAVTWNSDYDWGKRGTFYPSVMNFETSAGVGYLSGVVPSRDQVLNVHYKFGPNFNNDLQYLGTTGIEHYNNGILPLYFPSTNPINAGAVGNSGPSIYLDPATGLCSSLPSGGGYEFGLFPGQTACNQATGGTANEHDDQGYFIDKLQLTHTFSSNASLAVHYARVGSFVTFWVPFGGGAFDDVWENRHSDQQEAYAEYTLQANSQHLLRIGGQQIYSTNLEVVALPSSQIGEVFPANNRDKSYWIADTFKPNDRFTFNLSGRRDSRTYYPLGGTAGAGGGTIVPGPSFTDSANQLRGGFAYQLGQNTVIRGSDGNFVELPYMTEVNRFLTLAPNYADISPGNVFNVRNAHPDVPQSHSYDFSLEQNLGRGMALKVTPFWRKTDNLILTFKFPGQVASSPQAVGPYLVNGVESEIQFPHLGQGLSGYINYTHTRALAAVTGDFAPSLPPGAQFYHALFPASFVPANVANLVLTIRHNKWEFNPEVNFQSGYPYGVGKLTYNNLNCPTGTGGGDPSQPCGAIVANPAAYQDTNGGQCGPGFCTQLIDPNESAFADGRVCCSSVTANLNTYYHVNSVTTLGIQWQNLNHNYRPLALEQNPFFSSGGFNGIINYGPSPYIPSSMNGSQEFLFTLIQKI
jgi:carboxypeptidase family protein